MDPTLSHALAVGLGVVVTLFGLYTGSATSPTSATSVSPASPTPATLGGTVLQGVGQFAATLITNALNNSVLAHAATQHSINQAAIPAPQNSTPVVSK